MIESDAVPEGEVYMVDTSKFMMTDLASMYPAEDIAGVAIASRLSDANLTKCLAVVEKIQSGILLTVKDIVDYKMVLSSVDYFVWGAERGDSWANALRRTQEERRFVTYYDRKLVAELHEAIMQSMSKKGRDKLVGRAGWPATMVAGETT